MSVRLRNVLILIAAISVVLLLIWLLRREPRTQPKVGVILALTGKADYIGKPERDVLQAMLKDYEEHTDINPDIKLEIRDSGGDVANAATIFDQFVTDNNILAIIGPSTSGESIALAKKAEEAKIPLLSLAASRQIVVGDDGKTRSWVFKFAQNDDLAAQRLLLAITNNKHPSIALLYSDDGFGKSGADAFRKAAAPKESSPIVTIDYDLPYPSSLTQPEPFVAGIPQSIQAIVIWGTSPGPALLLKELKRVGHKAQIYLSHGNASQDFIATAGPAAEGSLIIGSKVLLGEAYLSGMQNDPIKRYQNFWRSKFGGGAPSHFGGHARDALEALTTILGTKQAKTRSEIRSGLEDLKHFPGVTGTFTFSSDDHAGLESSAFETYVIRNGAFVPWEKSQ